MVSKDGGDDDDMWKDAVLVVINSGKASTSLLQRKLGIGYGRAAKYMDQMEDQGIIGQASGNKPREVLVGSIDEVFGSPADSGAVAVAPAGEGDVYDDMPDDDET